MKLKANICTLLILICVLCYGCGPSILYIGDSYTPKDTVEVFYDEKDVQKEYRAIGKMTNDKIVDYDVEVVKKEMIAKAKQVGADGIIFTDIGVERASEIDGDRLAVKATLIKYL